jgi:hypothetical protein
MEPNDKESIHEERSTDGTSIITSSWNESQEKLLKSIAERSNCMRWLHTQCNLHFESMNFWFTIPNVIISTLNGSFTMSLDSLFPDTGSQKAAQTVIGLISIFSAVLITMNQYVKSQQMMEAHRAAGLSYAKLYRMIMNELSLRRDQRSNGLEFMKLVRAEIDRLENTAPSILPSIIKKFNTQFKDRNIEKPEIAGDLDEVEINHEMKKKKSFLQKAASPRDVAAAASSMVRNAGSYIFRQVTPTHEIQHYTETQLGVPKPSNIIIPVKHEEDEKKEGEPPKSTEGYPFRRPV